MSDIFQATAEETTAFGGLTDGLPHTFIGLGAHSIFAIRSILEIVKPKRILEIGFDRGHSAAMWLGLSNASVISVDISGDQELNRAVEVLKKRYEERFKFLRADSTKISLADLRLLCGFDLAFIDGDHSEETAFRDLCLVGALGIPWIAMDDWLPRFGPGVQAAAKRAGFEPFAVFKQNIALGRFF